MKLKIMNIVNEENLLSSDADLDRHWQKIIKDAENKLVENEKLVQKYESLIDDLKRRVDFLRKSHIKINIDKFETEN